MSSSDPKNLRSFSYYFGLSMVIVYVALGSLLIFYDVPINVSRTNQVIVGILLVTYGLARAWARHRKHRQQEEREEDDTLNGNV